MKKFKINKTYEEIKRKIESGAVVVVTTHDPRLIDGLGADDVYRLEAGRLRGKE